MSESCELNSQNMNDPARESNCCEYSMNAPGNDPSARTAGN
jgi:hypothetical protein